MSNELIFAIVIGCVWAITMAIKEREENMK